MLSCRTSFFARWYIKVKVGPSNPNVSHTPRKHVSGGRHSPRKSKQTLCYLQMRISSQYWKYPSPNCKFGKLAPRLLTPFTSALWTLSQVSVNASPRTPISCCFPKSFLLPFCQLNMFASKWKQLPESTHSSAWMTGDSCRPLCCAVTEVCLMPFHLCWVIILHSGPSSSCSVSALLLFSCLKSYDPFSFITFPVLLRQNRRLFLLAKNHCTFYLLFDALYVWICVCGYSYMNTYMNIYGQLW